MKGEKARKERMIKAESDQKSDVEEERRERHEQRKSRQGKEEEGKKV